MGGSILAWHFALTFHVITLIVVQLYSGKFLTAMLYCYLHILSGVLLMTLTTYFTRRNELRTTFFDNMLEQQELGEIRHEKVQMINLALSVQ